MSPPRAAMSPCSERKSSSLGSGRPSVGGNDNPELRKRTARHWRPATSSSAASWSVSSTHLVERAELALGGLRSAEPRLGEPWPPLGRAGEDWLGAAGG